MPCYVNGQPASGTAMASPAACTANGGEWREATAENIFGFDPMAAINKPVTQEDVDKLTALGPKVEQSLPIGAGITKMPTLFNAATKAAPKVTQTVRPSLAGKKPNVPISQTPNVAQKSLFDKATQYIKEHPKATAATVATTAGVPYLASQIQETGAVNKVADNIFGDDKNGSKPSVEEGTKVLNEQKSLWDNMQNKDWWFNPVEGGAGDWDNRLFRLGEMMSHMGTPLSKRGDSPSKRWTTASMKAKELEAAKAKGTKPPTPLKIGGVKGYITESITDKEGSGFFNWAGMSDEEIGGAAEIINNAVTKKVRAVELKFGEGKADVQKITDEEIQKYLERNK